MKKILLLVLMFSYLISFSQEKKDFHEKRDYMIDEDAAKQTSTIGDVGIKKSIMSIRASDEAVKKMLLKYNGKPFLTFPESRENSIQMLDGIPTLWLRKEASELVTFKGSAQPGEYYVFQVGVYANNGDLKNLAVHFPALQSANGTKTTRNTCFNTEGTNYDGKPLKKTVAVKKGRVQPLWFGVQIPATAKGTYTGVVTIQPAGLPASRISVSVNVAGEAVPNKGYNDPARMARMDWLNSTTAMDDEITKGFIPIARKGNTISVIGRDIKIGKNGLPESITTFFDNNNLALRKTGEPVLARPFDFIIQQLNGAGMPLVAGPVTFKDAYPSKVQWDVQLSNKDVTVHVTAHAEYDGFIKYSLAVSPLKTFSVKDIRMEVPLQKEKSLYMMGLDREGGFRPKSWDWTWNVKDRDQDEVWLGGVNGGMKVKLKGANYKRQLINLYYEYSPLNEPESWGNGQKGGITIRESNNATLVNAYSGARTMVKGETYHYDFDLMITPFKLIDKKIQYGDRYYHSDTDTTAHFVQDAKRNGANIINIHHKKDIYPYIDYPFHEDNIADFKAFVDDAHKNNIQTKLYYTTREITANAPEIWAMRSLNNEIISPGPGLATRTIVNPDGPHPWLAENFREDFIPGWKCTFVTGKFANKQDIAVLTTPDTRMNNFWLEGLNWLVENIKIDGIYMDDLALDRETMKRARKVLDRKRPGSKIDMHTWNHYNKFGKYASSLNLYTDLLPYIDQLWIGEARNYNLSSDYWLVEVSGVPFGLTSQMLRDGGNPWRGMTFGITARLGWYRAISPVPIWKFWDEHRFQDKDIIGFWDPATPVKCNTDSAEATLFKGRDEVIIAVANWTANKQPVRLQIDWNKLGFDPANVNVSIPAISEFQDEQLNIDLTKDLILEGAKGYVIVIKRK